MTTDTLAIDLDVAAAMNGDRDAFDRIVQRCASMVCSIALAIVRNVAASEDVAQEVFFAAWRSLSKLRNPASFLPWLRQVTRNQANEWLRTHAREVADDALLASAVDGRALPDDALLRAEERELLARVIDELPDDAREVIILYYREGSSAKHVADLLGIREDAVKQRLSRARMRIREELLATFGRAIAMSAPGPAFVAKATTAKGTGLALLLKGAGLGAALGIGGVLLGTRSAKKRARTAEQLTQLRRFTAVAITVVVLAAFAFTVSSTALSATVVWIAYVVALGYLYRVRLPRIVPQTDRRERIRSWIGFTIGVICGTAGLIWGLTH